MARSQNYSTRKGVDSIADRLKNDLLSRIIYSTDASAYREMPEAVYYPKCEEDIVDLVKYAAESGCSIIPRAAGTSLAGQVVGSGIVADISKYMKEILEVNVEQRWVRVQPGVVLDELNNYLKPFGLFFGPETSTSNRCCMAGMVGNNSCGSHSLVYGSTRDHLLEAKVVLSDGSSTVFRSMSEAEVMDKVSGKSASGNVEREIYAFLYDMWRDNELKELISREYPDPVLRRRNTGYALDELLFGENLNLCKLLAGSEGTLAFITELKLALVPLPPAVKGLVCAHCETKEQVFLANLIALKHNPVAVEMMDSNILELSKGNISQNKNRFFVKGDPAAILIVELAFDSVELLDAAVETLVADLSSSGLVYHSSVVKGADIPKVWELRKAGLGLLSSMKGDAKPVSVIEDTAVAPERLPEYMSDFAKLLEKYGLSCVYHAHIGTGELHLRPVLNLKSSRDVELFRIVARETAALVKRHRGSLSGEHGDGRLRGEFLEIMYGSEIYELFKRLKFCFDPGNVFNRNKITDTPAMNVSLRYAPANEVSIDHFYFRYDEAGGFLRAIEQCNGSGDCRKASQFGGVMCPSFRATGDEKDTTRARANLLREMISYPRSSKIFDSPEFKEVLDLCISCKGCKSECPSNVDMAKYKAEVLQQIYDVKGAPIRSKLISEMPLIQSIFYPVRPIYNFFASFAPSAWAIKSIMGFSHKRSIPLLSKVRLRDFLKSETFLKVNSSLSDDKAFWLFIDEFTDLNDAEIGIKFVLLMHSLGYKILVPRSCESGRTALSKGFLKKAAAKANYNVVSLAEIVTDSTPLVGLEPSCILSFRDEYPALVSDELVSKAKLLASRSLLFDEFIMREFRVGKIDRELFTDNQAYIKLHGHCHQKSLASVAESASMLQIPKNYVVETLPTGCCGMAGAFGYERDHYEISMKIGEEVLFPSIRDDVKVEERAKLESKVLKLVAAPGTSCRQQILDGTGIKAMHPVEILFDALR